MACLFACFSTTGIHNQLEVFTIITIVPTVHVSEDIDEIKCSYLVDFMGTSLYGHSAWKVESSIRFIILSLLKFVPEMVYFEFQLKLSLVVGVPGFHMLNFLLHHAWVSQVK